MAARVLILSWEYPPIVEGGLARHVRKLSEQLVALGSEVHVFGNIAVALAACEMTQNDGDTNGGVEALLLIKDAGVWRIVSQAWDRESESKPIPVHLVGGKPKE